MYSEQIVKVSTKEMRIMTGRKKVLLEGSCEFNNNFNSSVLELKPRQFLDTISGIISIQCGTGERFRTRRPTQTRVEDGASSRSAISYIQVKSRQFILNRYTTGLLSLHSQFSSWQMLINMFSLSIVISTLFFNFYFVITFKKAVQVGTF